MDRNIFRITNETPSAEDIKTIRDGLAGFNRVKTGLEDHQSVALLLRSDEGKLVGGLLGEIHWDWLAINFLWLAEEVRGQGWGSRLLTEAERIAVQACCVGAHLETMSFQAPGFYERHGYAIFGILEDKPRGHKRFFMQKRLPALLS